MKERQQSQHSSSLRVEQLMGQRNSSHATKTTTSSSTATAAVAAASSKAAIMAATATAAATTSAQMRATLIYLAPFLHSCKNVAVPGGAQQTTTNSAAPAMALTSKLCPASSHAAAGDNGRVVDLDPADEDALPKKTHVAVATSSLSCTSSACPAANDEGVARRGGRGVSGRNTEPPYGTQAEDNGGQASNHNNNAINCNSTIVTCDGGERSHCHCSCCRNSLDSDDDDDEDDVKEEEDMPMRTAAIASSSALAISSSCCHNNNNNTQPLALEKAAAHISQDKYYENYEMPALETTSNNTTTTTTASTPRSLPPLLPGSNNNNKITQLAGDDAEGTTAAAAAGHPMAVSGDVGATQTDNPSLSCGTVAKAKMSVCGAYAGAHGSNNYTHNGRSTKCLRERGRRNMNATTATATTTLIAAGKHLHPHNCESSRDHKYAMHQQQQQPGQQTPYDSSSLQAAGEGASEDVLDVAQPKKQQQQQRQHQLALEPYKKEFNLQRSDRPCPCGPLCAGHRCGGPATAMDNPHYHSHHNQSVHQQPQQQQCRHQQAPQQPSPPLLLASKKCCNNNNQMANTSLLSRCHCINNMLCNAKHNNCASQQPTRAESAKQQVQAQQHSTNSCCCCFCRRPLGVSHGRDNLILRNSSGNCKSGKGQAAISHSATTPQARPVSSMSKTCSSPSYVLCATSSSSPSSSSSSLHTSSTSTTPSSSSLLPSPTALWSPLCATETSYTTILNTECRCFTTTTTTKKRDIIGSETQANDAYYPASHLTAPVTSSSASASATISATASVITCNPNQLSGSTTPCLLAPTCIDHSDERSYCLIRRRQEPSSPLSLAPSSALSASTPPPLAFGWLQWLVVSLFGCSNKLTKTVTVSKWLFMWLLLIVLSSSAHCWSSRNDVPTNCTFPARWEGSWFLSGYQQSIHIKGSQFSYRGRCAASDGNKYLIVDEKGCHRCLVIYEKHKNVLQYKESECEGDSMYMHQTNPSAMAMRSVLNQKPTGGTVGDHRGGAHPNVNGHSRLSSSDQHILRSNDDTNDCPPDFCKGRETLQNLCDQIPGDALLYSLFRESAEPVKCPLKGPFIFTYNRGNGECKSPVSNIESCTEDSRLLLSFQACPDVVGTESTVEELTCLATWKDGNSRYLVGLVSHHHAISNEERYRCFVYEKMSAMMDMSHFGGPSMSTSKDAEYKLAQSGDATCNGLDSAEVGSRIMSLRKPPITERCDFPAWFKGPRHWHVLMGNAVYNYHTNDGSIHIIKPNGYMDTRALCEQINKQTATEMMSVVHYTTGCQSGFMCMVFYRRDTHIIEIQTGKPASRLEDACAADHFDVSKTPYITLLASNPDPQICPMEGLYTLRGAIGPPYMTTRHKRNHNNKVHGIHNHHHQYDSNERGFMHRRHQSLSFRNSANPNEKNAWHSNTRGLPVRSRREASSTTTKPSANVIHPLSPSSSSTAQPADEHQQQQQILVVGNSTSVGFVQDHDDSDSRLRSRRNVPECVTNYKAQRQLWIGCTEPNVIDVRPLCNDEGNEEYSCHGSWSENGTVYIIARHKGTKHGVCISYRPTEGTNAKLVVGDACYRGTQKPPEHHLEANLSVFGKCGETGSISSTMPRMSWTQLTSASLIFTLLSQLPIQR